MAIQYLETAQRTKAANWLQRPVLVTGASGFLGHAVCALLQELGARVHGTWRSCPAPPGVLEHHADLPADAHDLLIHTRPEVVIHLAAPVQPAAGPDRYETLRAGILDGTQAVARACMDAGVRLLLAGTCDEYGDGEPPLSESSPLRPFSTYGALKAAATLQVQAWVRGAGLLATIVRPFRAYGPYDRSSVIAQACRHALEGRPFEMTSGDQVREWNHVDAIAEGVLAAAELPPQGEVYNLGGGPRASVREVVDRVFQLAGADPGLVRAGALPRRPGEPDRFYADTTKAQAAFGPLPDPGLDDGLTDALEWYRSAGVLR